MAFNPFDVFRKNQKFWIFGLILLCMLAFIVCGGMGSQEWFTAIIHRFTGGSGPAVAVINNRDVGYKEFKELETNRKIANEFMRASTEIAIENLNQLIEDSKKRLTTTKNEDTKKSLQEKIGQHQLVRQNLQQKIQQPHYFGSGTKLDEMIAFILWNEQADRLGIRLVNKSVQEEVSRNLLAPITYYGPRDSQMAERRVQDVHGPQITTDMIQEALRQEFRVQLAKLSLSGARVQAILQDPTGPQTPAMQAAYARLMLSISPVQTRYPMTPDELLDSYNEHLTRFDVALLPVKVEDFVAKTATPSQGQLKELFEKYQKNKQDPTSDVPGFVRPEKMKIRYVTADPSAKHYKNVMRAVSTLETTPPVWWDAGLPGFGTALRVAAGRSAWDASMERNFENDKKLAAQNDQKFAFMTAVFEDGLVGWWTSSLPRDPAIVADALPGTQRFLQEPLTDPNFDVSLYTRNWKPDPAAIASLIGSSSLPGLYSFGPADYLAAAIADQKELLKDVVQAEIKQRVPIGASIVLAGASPTPFGPLMEWDVAYKKINYLPFEIFEEQYREQYQRALAANRVKEEMEEVREYLQKRQGNRKELETRLSQMKAKYPGLKIGETEEMRTEYDIADDAGMTTFKEIFADNNVLNLYNYIEGRKGTEKIVTEEDFDSLFFDTGELYSLASQPAYMVMQWPPEAVTPKARPLFQDPAQLKLAGVANLAEGGVKIDMWRLPQSDQYVLFWKSEYQQPLRPESLQDVEKDVIHTWKFLQARDKFALAKTKEIAEQLQKDQRAERDYLPTLREAAKKLGGELIMLDNVSEWVPIPRQEGLDYGKWRLPKKKIRYARADMTEEILSLNQLKAAIKTATDDKGKKLDGGDAALDTLNKDLFQKKLVGGNVKQIQVLTNKPRSVYYVAVVVREHPPQRQAFDDAYIAAIGMGKRSDLFVAIAREIEAQEHIKALTKQLRDAADVQVKNAQGFD